MTTRSTKEAMDLLKQQRARLRERAIRIAEGLCRNYGTTTTPAVYAEMMRLHLIPPGVRNFWLGSVFNRNPRFEWTGRVVSYSDSERNVHERTVKVWRLKAA